MAQIDSYLNRLQSINSMSFQVDLFDLYQFVPNNDLRTLLAVYHTQLNHWFSIINGGIASRVDDDGFQIYLGGYFHAQDSRDLIDVIEAIDQLSSKCSTTEYAFRLSNDHYNDVIKQCRKFLSKYRGSTIPEGFPPIDILEIDPIFQMENTIAIVQDKKKLYANMKSIGEGSYARVFSYIDPYYSIPVILKRARPELDSKEKERFKREFDVLKGLHSPYVIEVYAYNEENVEYTMECMDESIYHYMRRKNNSLSLAEGKKIIAQICRGLSYMHKKGLLHRDISPMNVLITHYDDVDVVKISDFGLVKIPESNLTSIQSELKGSLNDPDLINVGFSNYEMCHEIYALTRLCYYVLTGRINIENQKNVVIKQFWTKGTNPNRNERFKSVDELLRAVMNISE